MTKKQKKMLTRILVAALMLIGLKLIPTAAFSRLDGLLFPGAGRWLRLALYLVEHKCYWLLRLLFSLKGRS